MTIEIRPDEALLVDVDTQIDFVEPTGALYVPGADELKTAFRRLVQSAQKARVPILASADAHPEDDPEFEQFPPHCVVGTRGQRRVPETDYEVAAVVPADGAASGELSPTAGRPVVLEKTEFDLFANPAATAIANRTDRKTAVVFGVALDYCVRAAALGFAERGWATVLIEDATAPVSEEKGAETLEELRGAGVKLTTTDEVVRAFGGAA